MSILHTLFKLVDRSGAIPAAQAHCDIPCKIYDPSTAIIAALSVVRMMDIMKEQSEKSGGSALGLQNTLGRLILQKEEEAEKVKHEIRVIWGDYFKAPQFEKHGDVHELAHKIMLKASACKQEVNRGDAEELVELVNQFAEKFWDTKGVATVRKTCPYPPAMDVVYPVL